MRAFFSAPPCIYCRRSCPVFVAALEHETGLSLREYIRQGRAVEFLFHLRAKVNMKLHAQHLSQFKDKLSGVTFQDKTCSLPPRNISWPNFQKRVDLWEALFGAEDVLVVLHAMRLDFDPMLIPHYRAFVHGVVWLVVEEARQRSGVVVLGSMHRIAQVLVQQLPQVAHLATRADFDSFMLRPTLCIHPQPRASSANEVFARYNVLTAGVKCEKESCAA